MSEWTTPPTPLPVDLTPFRAGTVWCHDGHAWMIDRAECEDTCRVIHRLRPGEASSKSAEVNLRLRLVRVDHVDQSSAAHDLAIWFGEDQCGVVAGQTWGLVQWSHDTRGLMEIKLMRMWWKDPAAAVVTRRFPDRRPQAIVVIDTARTPFPEAFRKATGRDPYQPTEREEAQVAKASRVVDEYWTPFRISPQHRYRDRVTRLAEGPLDSAPRSLESWRQFGWAVDQVRWLRPGQAVIAGGVLHVSDEQVCPARLGVIGEWATLEIGPWRIVPRTFEYPCGSLRMPISLGEEVG